MPRRGKNRQMVADSEAFSVLQTPFYKVADDWHSLFKESGSNNPFLSPAWQYLWASAFQKNWPDVSSVWCKDKLVAVAWFQKGRDLQFFADSFFADYANLLVHPDFEEAGRFLIAQTLNSGGWRKAQFEPLRQDEKATALLQDVLGAHYGRKSVICDNPVVETVGDFEVYLKNLSKKLKQEIRTSTRRLEEKGAWRFIHPTSEKEKREIFQKLISFHLQRQNGKAGHSIFEEAPNIKFFDDLLSHQGDHFTPHLSAIELNGEIISACYSLLCGGVFYYWIPSFDTTIKSVSLGKLHIKMLLEHSFKSDIRYFDFMGGNEPYKYQWQTKSSDLVRVTLFRSKAAALAYDVRMGMIHMARDAKNYSLVGQKIWVALSKFRKD